MQDRPKARTEGVVAEHVADELVMYDEATQMGHCLSATAASVWEHCDGSLTPADIAQALNLESTAVEQAVHELRGCGLLEDGPVREGGYSRREAAVKVAKVGGATFMAPLIYSVAIGPATAAASTCIANGATDTTCTAGSGSKATDARCCSGTCYKTSGGAKICVSATCALGGAFCVLSGAGCCSGACFILACTS